MREGPLVSVVIPSYNRKDKILKSVDSVLEQSYENLELIVVDDGSDDGTWELFENFPDRRLSYIRCGENLGACHARNLGAERAAGELIAFQDSDDSWHKDKLEKQVKHLKATGADLSFCGMNRISSTGSSFYYPVHPFHPEKGLEEMLAENRAGTQTMLMRREVWKTLRFDESFRRYQDWDFSIRAAERFSLAYLPEALADSEVGTDSISALVNSYQALLHLYNKHLSLYRQYPASDAVMNRRMGKRLRRIQPEAAAVHFLKSFKISANPYDLFWYIRARIRAGKGGKVL